MSSYAGQWNTSQPEWELARSARPKHLAVSRARGQPPKLDALQTVLQTRKPGLRTASTMAVHTNVHASQRLSLPISSTALMTAFFVACHQRPTPVPNRPSQSSPAEQLEGNADRLRAVQTTDPLAGSAEDNACAPNGREVSLRVTHLRVPEHDLVDGSGRRDVTLSFTVSSGPDLETISRGG